MALTYPTNKMKSLFDNIDRKDKCPVQRSESTFTWLNKSAKPACDRIRQEIEGWYSHYPADHQQELYTRFRSKGFPSAFFELFIHELLLKLGCHPTVHPKLNNTGKCPDFFVESIKGNFYIEAVLVNESDYEVNENARINRISDILDRNLDSPNFFIGMDIIETSDMDPPARQITEFLADKLTTVDPDSNENDLPKWEWGYQKWKFVFYPIPKSPKLRGKPGVRPTGKQFYGTQGVDLLAPIRDNIIKKVTRYGQLNLPYIITINILNEFVNRIDLMEALFGEENFRVSHALSKTTTTETGMVRKPYGIWRGPNGPICTRVSAVLITNRLLPWNISRDICLYHNPWAEKPYVSELCCLNQVIPNYQEDKMEFKGGETLEKVFNFSKNWPE